MTEDQKRIAKLRRQVNRVRDFPTHTCPASRHLHIMANRLLTKGGYPMLTDEADHCAETMLAVLLSLWRDRKELAKLKARK